MWNSHKRFFFLHARFYTFHQIEPDFTPHLQNGLSILQNNVYSEHLSLYLLLFCYHSNRSVNLNRMPGQCPCMHILTHIHTYIHLAPSRCFVHRCLPRNPQVSVFSRRRVGEQNHWRRPLHPNIKQNTRGKKNVQKTFQKGKEGKKAKDFLIHPLLRWLVFGSATFFMCEKPGL